MALETMTWTGESLRLIDQTRLPRETAERECRTVEEVWQAIKVLAVRGAPAIGIAAAWGVALGARTAEEGKAREAALAAAEYLATSRPTAVNLFWALDRMKGVIAAHGDEATLVERLAEEARAIHDEDRDLCRRIGEHGLGLVGDKTKILTHCNAGGLATSERGTALSVIYAAHEAGRPVQVVVDETRPLLQGARLTATELHAAGVPVTLICDSMAGIAMARGMVEMVVVGADRIARNGDVANKIGTYPLALVAKHHGIPFYVAAPTTTFDLSLESGAGIPIEERRPEEIFEHGGTRLAPEGIGAFNPAFDVTPAELIAGIITERGVIAPPNEESVRAHFAE